MPDPALFLATMNPTVANQFTAVEDMSIGISHSSAYPVYYTTNNNTNVASIPFQHWTKLRDDGQALGLVLSAGTTVHFRTAGHTAPVTVQY